MLAHDCNTFGKIKGKRKMRDFSVAIWGLLTKPLVNVNTLELQRKLRLEASNGKQNCCGGQVVFWCTDVERKGEGRERERERVCVCVCLCVCVCVYVCVKEREGICVCTCERVREREREEIQSKIHTHMHTNSSIPNAWKCQKPITYTRTRNKQTNMYIHVHSFVHACTCMWRDMSAGENGMCLRTTLV